MSIAGVDGARSGPFPEFVTRISERGNGNIPLLLLHGSSGTEDSLADLADAIAPQRSFIALRGPVPWEDGYAFFRRNPDRSLDTADLAGHCRDICDFLRHAPAIGGRRPVLVGYSNGAIMAAAILATDAGLTSGAILLRPLSPQPETPFPPLHALPVLVLAAEHDTRRHPADAPALAAQLVEAGAKTEFQTLPCGHGLDEGGADVRLARAWLDTHCPA